MSDGGMGSLRLIGKQSSGGREFGRQLAAVRFIDLDGTIVVATLCADKSGDPFELDLWKTDFSPLKRIPEAITPLDE
jgi:hypothetical protein